MSTLKTNEIRHISNNGTANIVLESNENVNLRTTSTQALTVTGNLTVSNTSTMNGNTVLGNASSDTVTLTATVSGKNNYSGFTGEMKMYAGNAAGDDPPAGWLYCNGDTISQTSGNGGNHHNSDGKGNDYQDLFNLLKASSDWGNSSSASWGTNTVKVPDFRSRSPVGVHTGAAVGNDIGTGSNSANLTQRTLGDTTGEENHLLITAELPAHTHTASSASVATGMSATSALVIEALLPNHVHPMAHTHTYAHTHGVDHDHPSATSSSVDLTTEANSAGLTTASQSADSTASGNATHDHGFHHTHEFVGDDMPNYGSITKISQSLNYDAESGSGTHGWLWQTSPQSGTGRVGSENAAHAHTFTHSHTSAAHTHTIDGHTHTVDVAAYTGNTTSQNNTTTSAVSTANTTNPTTNPSIAFTGASNSGNPAVTTSLTDPNHNHAITVNNTGSGTTHNNLSPLIAVHYIIKV